jgi:hypothetical protein
MDGSIMLLCCRIASGHFSQVEANKADGLVTTIAGIQDLNILFSSVAFVAVLRAFVQVMEAGIKDPDLVVYLQVSSLFSFFVFSSPSLLRTGHSHYRMEQYEALMQMMGLCLDALCLDALCLGALCLSFVILLHRGARSADVRCLVQAIGGGAILLRSIVLQQLIARKRRGSRPKGPGRGASPQFVGLSSLPFLLEYTRLMTQAPIMARSIAGRSNAALHVALKLQMALQALPNLFFSPCGKLLNPMAVFRKATGLSITPTAYTAAVPPQDVDALIRNTAAGSKQGRESEMLMHTATSTVDLFSEKGLRLAKPQLSPTAGRTSMVEDVDLPSITAVALTSVDKGGLMAAEISSGLLQSVSCCTIFACRS